MAPSAQKEIGAVEEEIVVVTRLKMFVRERNFIHSKALLKCVTKFPWCKLYSDGDGSASSCHCKIYNESFL